VFFHRDLRGSAFLIVDLYAALQAVLNGLLTGALYALVGMGMALIFGVMRIVNFAHGAFMMVGMYVTYVLFTRTGISPYALFVVTGLALFTFGYGVYFALLRPIHGQSDFMQILLTMGIGLICSDAVLLTFGADYHQINIPLQDSNLRFGPEITVNAPWVVSFAIAAVLALALYLFVTRTMTGRAARAIAQNRYAAPLMGINVFRVQAISFAVGSAAAGVAGALLLPVFYLYPGVGDQFTLKAFVMVVLGGMESIVGAALAGLVLGVVENLTSLYWGNEWALAVDFGIFLLVLSLKPSGIFGRHRA
jgi:branched-chain amino acid transport system permease protein